MLLYSARGQQLRNCIPVEIGRDTFEFDQKHVKNQESSNHSARFVKWKSITIIIVRNNLTLNDIGLRSYLENSHRFCCIFQ